ncbi:unnamed protein product [Diatraea saccharalis]|uniref:Uncharacterized protein n=1 Tax=Diatraea saccharalis TaxID=40085 RepID=A0A9N9WAQ1_9NEOP|nr:unnamed protein product [Diatraea saccharalis]
MMSKPRTAGDGMESDESTTEKGIKTRTKEVDKNIPLSGKLIQIYPTNVLRSEKKKSINSKTPKFVPYEPYAGAVKPITPNSVSKGSKKSRNNMDINTLISQMSQMNTNLNEFKPRQKLSSSSDKISAESNKECAEKAEIEKRLNLILSENESLKEQLKQQVQVNKELKTMLVASMGEDLETQVQSLNEDKKHLANALLNSAQHLSTHQVIL